MRKALVFLAGLPFAACAAHRPLPPPYPGAGQVGVASWYGLEEQGRRTASGEIMDPYRLSAAHPSLPFGTELRVTDLDTGRSVIVVVNDRGPFARGRILDLSYGAAQAIGIVEKGVARIRLEVLAVDPGLLTTRWVVQVGSFRDEGQARAVSGDLEQSGYASVRVSPHDLDGRVFYRVQVGAFTERAPAETMAQQMRSAGLDAIVIQAVFPQN